MFESRILRPPRLQPRVTAARPGASAGAAAHTHHATAKAAIIQARRGEGGDDISEQHPDTVTIERELRVLIANERPERLALLTEILTKLGHVVVAAGVEIEQIGETTRREHPDVALVALGESSDHALELISKIVHEAACPVIALLHTTDPSFVNEAGKRGIFAHITDDDPQQLQSTLDIVLHRFAEYHNLEGAFARRATIERAKGILMATHSIDDQQAFELLRKHSQQSGQKLLDLAEAITQSHRLLAQPHDR